MPDGGFDLVGMLGQAAKGPVTVQQLSTPAAAPQSGSYPVVPPHAAPDGSGEETNLSDADYAKFNAGQTGGAAPAADKPAAPPSAPSQPPPGAQSFDLIGLLGQAAKGPIDYKPPPAPPDESTTGGIGKNLAAGLAEGGINALAAPVNLANSAANLGIRGINALTGANIPQFSTDVGGEASRAIAHATGGFSPTEVPANGTLERMARASGNVVASLPGMALGGAALEAAAPAGSLAGNVGGAVAGMPVRGALAPVMTGAAVGQGASEAVPEKYAPLANLAGNLAGGGLTVLGQEGALAAGRFAANQAGRFNFMPKEAVPIPGGGTIRATQAQQNIAARSLYDAGGEDLRNALNTAPRELVPGDQPTTAQLAPTPGVVNLEKAMRQRPSDEFGGPAFQERAEAQNAARLNAIQGAAPANANPDSLGAHVAAQLGAIQDEDERAVAGATGAVQGRTEALGGFGAPEQRGQVLRGAVDQNSPLHAAARQNESALWQAIDPNGTLGVSILPLKQAQAELAGEMNPLAGDALHPSESLVFQGIPRMPDVVSYRTLSALRKNIGAAERAINGSLNPSGVDPQALRRLAILKSGVDASIADTINMVAEREAGAVAAGQMNPADTILGRIQADLEAQHGTGAAVVAGQGAGTGVETHSQLQRAGPVPSASFGESVSPRGEVGPSAGSEGVSSAVRSEEPVANFDQAAADRYSAAREATRQRKQTYTQGVVGKILQPGRGGAEHAVADANVPRTLLSGGPDEATRVADFLTASGPAGHEAIKQALVGDLRDKGIIDADGLIGKGYDKWLARHARAIEQVPGLSEQFRDAGAAQHTLAETMLAHAQRVKAFQDGIAGKLLGEEPGEAVRRALSGQNSTQNLNKLVDLVRGNADATDSLKLHVVRAILDRFAPVGRAGATMENALNPNLEEHSFLNANAYKTWVDANKAPLRRLFGGQGIQNLERVASSLRRAQYARPALAGSQTAPNMLNAAKHEMGGHGHGGWNTAMALIGEHVGEHIGLGGLLGVLGGTVGRAFLMASRAAGVETINDLKAAAMLHPDLAKALLERIPPDGKLNGLFGRRLVGAMRSLAVANAGQQATTTKEPETPH